jgi:hypothetical protein
MTRRVIRGVAAVTCLAVTAAFAEEAAQRPILPAGSLIRVRMKTTLSDKTNKNGDVFVAQTIEPVMANGEEIIPGGSTVNGHVAFVKESGRIKGVAEMRLVLDSIVLPEEDVRYNLSASLEDAHGADCMKVADPEEGVIKGCGKSAKQTLKNAAIGGAIGAGAGLTVGMIGRGGCDYYGCWPSSGPGVGTAVAAGAGLGVGTMLLYSLFKHNKHIILVQGSELTFTVNRSVNAEGEPPAAAEPPKP